MKSLANPLLSLTLKSEELRVSLQSKKVRAHLPHLLLDSFLLTCGLRDSAAFNPTIISTFFEIKYDLYLNHLFDSEKYSNIKKEIEDSLRHSAKSGTIFYSNFIIPLSNVQSRDEAGKKVCDAVDRESQLLFINITEEALKKCLCATENDKNFKYFVDFNKLRKFYDQTAEQILLSIITQRSYQRLIEAVEVWAKIGRELLDRGNFFMAAAVFSGITLHPMDRFLVDSSKNFIEDKARLPLLPETLVFLKHMKNILQKRDIAVREMEKAIAKEQNIIPLFASYKCNTLQLADTIALTEHGENKKSMEDQLDKIIQSILDMQEKVRKSYPKLESSTQAMNMENQSIAIIIDSFTDEELLVLLSSLDFTTMIKTPDGKIPKYLNSNENCSAQSKRFLSELVQLQAIVGTQPLDKLDAEIEKLSADQRKLIYSDFCRSFSKLPFFSKLIVLFEFASLIEKFDATFKAELFLSIDQAFQSLDKRSIRSLIRKLPAYFDNGIVLSKILSIHTAKFILNRHKKLIKLLPPVVQKEIAQLNLASPQFFTLNRSLDRLSEEKETLARLKKMNKSIFTKLDELLSPKGINEIMALLYARYVINEYREIIKLLPKEIKGTILAQRKRGEDNLSIEKMSAVYKSLEKLEIYKGTLKALTNEEKEIIFSHINQLIEPTKSAEILQKLDEAKTLTKEKKRSRRKSTLIEKSSAVLNTKANGEVPTLHISSAGDLSINLKFINKRSEDYLSSEDSSNLSRTSSTNTLSRTSSECFTDPLCSDRSTDSLSDRSTGSLSRSNSSSTPFLLTPSSSHSDVREQIIPPRSPGRKVIANRTLLTRALSNLRKNQDGDESDTKSTVTFAETKVSVNHLPQAVLVSGTSIPTVAPEDLDNVVAKNPSEFNENKPLALQQTAAPEESVTQESANKETKEPCIFSEIEPLSLDDQLKGAEASFINSVNNTVPPNLTKTPCVIEEIEPLTFDDQPKEAVTSTIDPLNNTGTSVSKQPCIFAEIEPLALADQPKEIVNNSVNLTKKPCVIEEIEPLKLELVQSQQAKAGIVLDKQNDQKKTEALTQAAQTSPGSKESASVEKSARSNRRGSLNQVIAQLRGINLSELADGPVTETVLPDLSTGSRSSKDRNNKGATLSFLGRSFRFQQRDPSDEAVKKTGSRRAPGPNSSCE